MTLFISLKPARLRSGTLLLLVCCVFSAALFAARPPVAGLATAHPLATQAGMDILASGGNAFDAAVAVSAALAVVEPYGSGLGGGGFWLLHRERDGFEVMVDGREKAPLAAHRNMYLDSDGNVVPDLSVNGALAAGIPGMPAALVHIARRYGRLPLQHSLAPAIQLAREGFEIDDIYRKMAKYRLAALQDDLEAADIFLHRGAVPAIGHRLVQADLADTLIAIARFGDAGFYRGALARRLVEAGSRFITVTYGSWDMHTNIANGIKSQVPAFDQAFARLIRDLDDRGLLDSTLVCLASEFGRSPKINASAGRDHWPKVSSVVLAGGGIKRGLVHGSSDSTASEPNENPLGVEDWATTIYDRIGIVADKELMAPGDRPVEIVNGGKVRKALLA